ncbi:histidinol-phosphate transaminase [Natroniella sulfidigena]|uniref:histidinol-phosphate transaminase n=1 Tax=Natroniella sulfidigena TaxID=723921 RepID=UPI00200A49A7|nr:histidinol-phosphate transaminase [Natroniella sulfidigena]MCK8816918.1 histidinol-phosphate transaminase [Natroniella sulfidigena]
MINDNVVRQQILEIKPYVPGKPIEEVKRELGLDEVIKLASNENPLGPAPQAIEQMKKTAEQVNIYPDGNVHYLRQKLATKLGVKEEELIFGNGSDELLALLGQTFITEQAEVIMAGTTFSEYRFATNIMGGKIVTVPLKEYTHDLEAMAAAITPNTKLIFICNPNNPTGTIVTKDEVDNFLNQVPDDVIVIFDEAYYEYVANPAYPETVDYLADYENIIILRTFSKAYALAGLRIGYGIASQKLIDYIERVRQPFNVNLMAQKAAIASLATEDHLAKSVELNQVGKEYLYQEFDKLGLEYVPTGSNFILVDVAEDSTRVFEELMQRGVIIRDMSAFGYQTKIRVTVGLPEENEFFIEQLKEVLNN